MSERILTAEDVRRALIEVGYTHYEADDAIEAVKRRGISIGQEMARETVREATSDAVRKLQAIAWDEGAEAFQAAAIHPRSTLLNPYREDENDE